MTNPLYPEKKDQFKPLRWEPPLSLSEEEGTLAESILTKATEGKFDELKDALSSKQELSGAVIEYTLRQCPSDNSERVKSLCLKALMGKRNPLELLEQEKDPNRRVVLAHLLVDDYAGTFAYHFEHLFTGATVENRLGLCHEIVKKDEHSPAALAKNFNKLGLDGDDLREQRLSLCMEIAKQGDYAAKSLAENFNKLGLD
nr:hypothetical protein [Chlamydiota bacterium]